MDNAKAATLVLSYFNTTGPLMHTRMGADSWSRITPMHWIFARSISGELPSGE